MPNTTIIMLEYMTKNIILLREEFNNIDRIDELKEKYNPVLVTEADDYDIEEIIKYAKNLPSIKSPCSKSSIFKITRGYGKK